MKSKLSIIFVILPFLSSLLFSQDIKVLSSDRNSLIFEFVPIVDTSSAIINNEKYIKVNLSGGSYADTAIGMPWAQFKQVMIGIPSEFGNNFQVINSEFYEISGKLPPIPQTKFDKMGSSSEFAISDNYNVYENPDLLELGNYEIIRSIPVQNLAAQCTDARVNIVTATLFKKYKKPQDYLKVSDEELQEDIHSTGFYKQKAKSVKQCCAVLVEEYGGQVPADFDKLNALPGVGRKTASVVAGNCFGIPAIAVDTHVKRLSNLLGFIESDDPEKIEARMKELLPEEDWVISSH
ncbi:MAG TPA: hypothetical protein VHP30_14160, partial [Ignavibacteriales bacterium]|nr:hypothetical protein [Ignavibacteriales bacterium]